MSHVTTAITIICGLLGVWALCTFLYTLSPYWTVIPIFFAFFLLAKARDHLV